jgi:hypothetical protein
MKAGAGQPQSCAGGGDQAAAWRQARHGVHQDSSSLEAGRPSNTATASVLLSLIWGITTGCLSYAPKGKLPAGVCLIIIGTEGTPEPVFGIIKAALGFRQFSLRGLDKARGEWSLVTMAWNMKRIFALGPA